MNRNQSIRSASASALVVAAVTGLANLCPASATAAGNDFKTPTGDVYCQTAVYDDGTSAVTCEGGGHYAGPKPVCVGGNWGDRFSLTEGEATEVECHTDTIRSNQASAPVLDYGQTRSIGPITCDSESSGLTCTDTSTGNYFTMSETSNSMG